jgi:hypothetical protein
MPVQPVQFVNFPLPTPSAPAAPAKPAEPAAKKKSGARTKKAGDSAGSAGSGASRKSESQVGGENAPLRATNTAALEAMGLSWQEPKYQPHPSLHPMKMALVPHHSSRHVQIHQQLAINARGYNLVRANYPVQRGNWYFEVLVTDAMTLIQQIRDYQDQRDAVRDLPVDTNETAPVPIQSAPSIANTTSTETSEAPLNAMNVQIPAEEIPLVRSETPCFLPPLNPPIGDPSQSELPTDPSQSSIIATNNQQTMIQTPAPPQILFPNFDVSPFISLVSGLVDMAHLNDSTNRSLPEPHWRIGWATERADPECPVGTDVFGFAWRDDGTLFHTARKLPVVIERNKSTAVSEDAKSISRPSMEISADGVDTNQGFQVGDVLGFGIELPEENMSYIKQFHAHQEAELEKQDSLLNLRRQVHLTQVSMSYPGADLVALKAQIAELQTKIAAVPTIPPFKLHPSLPGTRLSFWKNGILQSVRITEIPPGSYYPAASMYYRAGFMFNFGPEFAHPPPESFRPASQLPEAYENPLPDAKFLPKPPVT